MRLTKILQTHQRHYSVKGRNVLWAVTSEVIVKTICSNDIICTITFYVRDRNLFTYLYLTIFISNNGDNRFYVAFSNNRIFVAI